MQPLVLFHPTIHQQVVSNFKRQVLCSFPVKVVEVWECTNYQGDVPLAKTAKRAPEQGFFPLIGTRLCSMLEGNVVPDASQAQPAASSCMFPRPSYNFLMELPSHLIPMVPITSYCIWIPWSLQWPALELKHMLRLVSLDKTTANIYSQPLMIYTDLAEQ